LLADNCQSWPDPSPDPAFLQSANVDTAVATKVLGLIAWKQKTNRIGFFKAVPDGVTAYWSQWGASSIRTFPALWRVEPTDGSHFVVKDATGFSVCYVYARTDSALRAISM
jgi:hypothetical protein